MEECIKVMMKSAVELFKACELTMFGITFTMWQLTLWFLGALVLIWVLHKFYD